MVTKLSIKFQLLTFFGPLFFSSSQKLIIATAAAAAAVAASAAVAAAVAAVARTKTLEMKGQNSNLRLDDQSRALQDWRESANKRKKKEGVARLQTSPRQTLSRLHFFDETRLKQCPAVLLISDATK